MVSMEYSNYDNLLKTSFMALWKLQEHSKNVFLQATFYLLYSHRYKGA